MKKIFEIFFTKKLFFFAIESGMANMTFLSIHQSNRPISQPIDRSNYSSALWSSRFRKLAIRKRWASKSRLTAAMTHCAGVFLVCIFFSIYRSCRWLTRMRTEHSVATTATNRVKSAGRMKTSHSCDLKNQRKLEQISSCVCVRHHQQHYHDHDQLNQ